MEGINKFIRGAKKGLDPTVSKPDEWTFPTVGVRIINMKNKGFVAVPMDGNSNTTTGYEFSVGENYVPIGGTEVNGILYLALANKLGNGIGAIGCYPSPKNYSTTNIQFEKQFKLLKNYDTGLDLETSNFNFFPNKKAEVIGKQTQDGSVNLYITDNFNPVRVFNTGFKQTGQITEKYIQPEEFNGALNLIPTSKLYPEGDLYEVASGGSNKPGMYEIHLRYSTKNFEPSRFMGKIWPIQIDVGNDSITKEGIQEVDFDNNQNTTDKKFTISIDTSTLDEGFEYLQIGIVRNTNNNNLGLKKETYLIDEFYNIQDLINNSNKITIYGTESTLDIPFEELMVLNPRDIINKSHTELDKRYYGANWNGLSYDKDSLRAYAEAIEADYHIGATIDDMAKFEQYEGLPLEANPTPKRPYQHKINDISSGKVTYDYTSRFRGEIYPFAIVGILKDGSITQAFPIKDIDMLDSTSYRTFSGEQKGLIRMPGINQTTGDVNINDMNKPMGVKFDNTTAISGVYNNSSYDFTNIIGFMIVEGDRIENLLYQGFLTRAAYGVELPSETVTTEVDFEDKILIPFDLDSGDITSRLYGTGEDFFPIDKRLIDAGTGDDGFTGELHNPLYDNKNYGFFSPDFMHEITKKISNIENLYATKLFDISCNYSDITAETSYEVPAKQDSNLEPSTFMFEFNKAEYSTKMSLDAKTPVFESVTANIIRQGTYKGPGNFSSLVNDYHKDGYNHALYHEYVNGDITSIYTNKAIQLPDYIGLNFSTSDTLRGSNIWALYRSENNNTFYDNTRSTYSVRSKAYKKLSVFFELDTDISAEILYKGDCFLQRTIYRQHRAHNGAPTDGEAVWDDAKYYGHGLMVSLLCENFHNLAMRNDVQNIDLKYTYYPKLYDYISSAIDWVYGLSFEDYYNEAFQINIGYDKVSLDKIMVGDTELEDTEYRFPVRVKFSGVYDDKAFIDTWRLVSNSNYQDYDISNGEINKITTAFNRLVAIQRDAIISFNLDFKEITNISSQENVLLQRSGLYLSERSNILARFGTEHQFGVVSVKGAETFGFDAKRGIIWSIGFKEKQFGAFNLGLEKGIEGWLLEDLDYYNRKNDITDILVDDTNSGIGIVSGYNQDKEEIYFTFLFRDNTFESITSSGDIRWSAGSYNQCHIVEYNSVYYYSAINSNTDEPTVGAGALSWIELNYDNAVHYIQGTYYPFGTLVYNEEYLYISPGLTSNFNIGDLALDPLVNRLNVTLDDSQYRTLIYDRKGGFFLGEAPFKPSNYFSLNGSIFSSKSVNNNPDKIYLHDQKDGQIMRFYNTDEQMIFSFFITGADARELKKEFLNFSSNMANETLDKIEFETERNISEIDFANLKFWNSPKYFEGKLNGPFPEASDDSDIYFEDSGLRGNYCKVTIKYSGKNPFYIRNFIYNFLISHI